MDAERPTMRSWKAACGLVCFLIPLSNIWMISHWSESRGVYTVPLAMLSLWSLLFASLRQPAAVAAEDPALARAAKA
jgi:hypothetical protein